MNVQYAVKDRVVYVLEVNPRACRTVPFVSKAIGVPLAKIAARCMVGQSLRDLGFTGEIVPAHVSVKEAVFPFVKFPGVDTVLGPEMKSTGEVMGIDATFGVAFAKAQMAGGTILPTSGSVFLSVPPVYYEAVVPIGERLARAGLQALRHSRNRDAPESRGARGHHPEQGAAGTAARGGRDSPRRGGPRGEHARGRRVVPRFVSHPAHRAGVPGAVLHHDRGGGRRGRWHRDPLARAGHGAAAAGALPGPMSTGPAPLAELLAVLAPPLDYLATAGFAGAARTGLPLDAIADRLARARRDAPVDAALDALAEVVAGLRVAPPDGREPLLRRAHALLERLRGAESPIAPARPVAPTRVAEAAGWREYRPATGAIEPALATLRQPVESLRAVGPKRRRSWPGSDSRRSRTSCGICRSATRTGVRERRSLRLQPGTEATTVGEVATVHPGVAGRQGRRILEVVVRDAGASAVLVWFNQVQFFAGRFRPGQRLLVHGRVEPGLGLGPPRLVHPDVTPLDVGQQEDRLPPVVPVYEKPTAMPVGVMRRIVQGALEAAGDRVPGAVPPAVARRQRLLDPARALAYLHRPPAEADLAALTDGRSLAHRSLIFDELFFLQLGLALRRSAAVEEPGTAFPRSRLA